MPERYASPLGHSEQNTTRPKADEYINGHLDGEMKKNALEFIAWLRANKMTIRWSSVDQWAANYKGKTICWITVYVERRETLILPSGNVPSWNIVLDRTIYMNGYRQNLIKEQGLQGVFWDNVGYCTRGESSPNGCVIDEKCAGGRDLTVLGKEFKGTCFHRSVQRFHDPDKETRECLKKLFELEIRIRDEEGANKQGKGKEAVQVNVSPFHDYNQNQKIIKPRVEQLIPVHIIDINMQKSALDLAAYLRANKMSPGWYGINKWKGSGKSGTNCFIMLWDAYNSWYVRLDLLHWQKYEETLISEGLQNIIWDSINHCHSCSGCAPGSDATILGKEFKGLCRGLSVFNFNSPDENMMKNIKRLLELDIKAGK